MPYFSRLKTCDIDTIRIRKWQNELISYRDEAGKPYSQTYLKTVNNQMSALMNYAVKHYGLSSNPCSAAGSIGKSHAEEMKFWTQEQYETFSKNIQKSALKLAFDILFYSGIRSGELLALTPADILPDRKISISKNFAKINGHELFLVPKTPRSRRNVSIPEFLYDDIQSTFQSSMASRKMTGYFTSQNQPWKKKSREWQKRQGCRKSGCMISAIPMQTC